MHTPTHAQPKNAEHSRIVQRSIEKLTSSSSLTSKICQNSTISWKILSVTK